MASKTRSPDGGSDTSSESRTFSDLIYAGNRRVLSEDIPPSNSDHEDDYGRRIPKDQIPKQELDGKFVLKANIPDNPFGVISDTPRSSTGTISDARAFTPEECPVWTYYIPKEREESEWDVYFVMLLQQNAERGLWERAGLGKVFKAAFREQWWDEIKLG
ncbi:hypothetical protein SLS62_001017 [Diatrype stigma]|uniref:Uncharacterized protein n=1 Tax=Diatrype stigma TaxID=117547 RepID=A0AAN9UZZ6_9PEZI